MATLEYKQGPGGILANDNKINNRDFVRFGIHLFLGQVDVIDNKNNTRFGREPPLIKPVISSGVLRRNIARDACINFTDDLYNSTAITYYIKSIQSQLDMKINNQNGQNISGVANVVTTVNNNEVENKVLGPAIAGPGVPNVDNSGIKRALKAVVECFIRTEAKSNHIYDAFRDWLVLDYRANDGAGFSPLAIPDNGYITFKDAINRWIAYRIEKKIAVDVQLGDQVKDLVNILPLLNFSVDGNITNPNILPGTLVGTEQHLREMKESLEKISKQSLLEYKNNMSKEGNSFYNELLLQNQVMRYFIKQANEDSIVSPIGTVDQVTIDLQYEQCNILVEILTNSGAMQDGNNETLLVTLNNIAANTNKFTGNASNNADAGANPNGTKFGWQWSGGNGNAGHPPNLHNNLFQSKPDIKLAEYTNFRNQLKNIKDMNNRQNIETSIITPIQHIQLIADLAVAKAALKMIEQNNQGNTFNWGGLSVSNAGVISYYIWEGIDTALTDDTNYTTNNNMIHQLITDYEAKAQTATATTDADFKRIVSLAPSMRIAVVGTDTTHPDAIDGGPSLISNPAVAYSNIDKLAGIHHVIFRVAAEAADYTRAHLNGCTEVAALTAAAATRGNGNQLAWREAIKAAINIANKCVNDITFV